MNMWMFSPLPINYAKFSVQVSKRGAPGVPDFCKAVAAAQGAFTSGSLGSVHLGAPTAPLTCEEEDTFLQEAEHAAEMPR